MDFKPRLLPRDFLDVLIGVPHGCLFTLVLLILPATVAAVRLFIFLRTHRQVAGSQVEDAVILALMTGAGVYCLLALVLYLFMVRRVKVNEDGLHFVRVWGSPKHLLWPDIVRIEEATRREVFVHGWLWPVFPSREMTSCLSAKCHFRIQWREGYCYFPPRDVELFRTTVVAYMNVSQAPPTLLSAAAAVPAAPGKEH